MDNQSTVHLFSNKNFLRDVLLSANPVNTQSSGGVTHCSLRCIIPDFGTSYYKELCLTNILSKDLIRELYNISYHNVDDTSTVHTSVKDIHFVFSRCVIYYRDCIPGQRAITMVQTAEGNTVGLYDLQFTSDRRDQCAYDMVGCRIHGLSSK